MTDLERVLDAARTAVREHGDDHTHTVAAAVLDEHDRIHVGLNLHHFTGGPCAEIVALATARTAGARDPRLIVAVGDDGRRVLAPCGRDRQVLLDYYPGIRVVIPTLDGLVTVPTPDLLPFGYDLASQMNPELRFHRRHLPTVRDGSKRITMRHGETPQAGPVTLVFELGNEVTMPGRITSTVAKLVREVTDEEAREDGFADAEAVLPGLREYYPGLAAEDPIVIVRFETT
ncbi:ASCH domain-containing protein [Kineosporia succinea]|uniref:Cytidine deaminase n=1 Tax=Kineosporia succinea TaxID=84632 RepID=A0ABT9PE69_9ACTN|nr:ASCH domain-containing protein [Kineosporia succinea]MDP9831007.1 cytidine deaminase [Kineosporia succinea]